MKKITEDEFFKRCKTAHGDRFDYSQTVFTKISELVKIICREHGEFQQRAHGHSKGKNGCGQCTGQERITVEKFVERSIAAHGIGRFDYSLVTEIKGIIKPVKIICTVEDHGVFTQIAKSHAEGGNGCARCNGVSRLIIEEVIRRGRKAYPDKNYDYSRLSEFLKADGTIQNGVKTRIFIGCPEKDHGYFEQTIDGHLVGKEGCFKCSNFARRQNRSDFISRSKQIHGEGRYLYDEVEEMNGLGGEVRLICPQVGHGSFEYSIFNHLQGHEGCSRCKKHQTVDLSLFLERAIAAHGDRFDYSQITEVRGHRDVLNIICKIDGHGSFTQLAVSHYLGYIGCRKCVPHGSSKSEKELFEFIQGLTPDAINGDWSVLDGKEIDILIPSLNLGFEFNGSWWHSDRFLLKDKGISAHEYHTQKLTGAASAGVSLYFVWESDWISSRSLIESAVTAIITAAQSNQSPDPFSAKLLSKLESTIEVEEPFEEETLLAA